MEEELHSIQLSIYTAQDMTPYSKLICLTSDMGIEQRMSEQHIDFSPWVSEQGISVLKDSSHALLQYFQPSYLPLDTGEGPSHSTPQGQE